MSLPAICIVLGNVRQLHPKDPGPVPKSATAVLTAIAAAGTALGLSAAEKQGELTHEQRDHLLLPQNYPHIFSSDEVGCEKTHPEPFLYFFPEGRAAPCMVWGMSTGLQCPAGCGQRLLRDITKELPSTDMVEGWAQHGTKDPIQPQLPPFGDELCAVSLEGKAQKMTDVSVGQQWQISADTGKGGRKSSWRQQKNYLR